MKAKVDASITDLLVKWKAGDRSVENQLAASIYPVLKEMASGQIRRNGGQLTLRPTALVSEAYERLAEQKSVDWQNRKHFYAIAATVLRRVLIDHLRQQSAAKRGGDVCFVDLEHPDALAISGPDKMIDWVDLDQALNRLAATDSDAARVVELRLFAGFGVEQIAQACDASISTVTRQWRFSRAWLAAELGRNRDSNPLPNS